MSTALAQHTAQYRGTGLGRRPDYGKGTPGPGQHQLLAGQIRAAGGQALAVETDVRSAGDVARLVKTAQTHFGRLDVMFSNAGSMAVSAFDELRTDEWELMVDVNVKGVLNGIAAALPVFRAQGSGRERGGRKSR